jgi:predicted dehydrogenase
MKFLIVGLGSMGKRRIRNLKYLKAGEIIGFDTMEARRKEAEEKYGIETFDDFEKANEEQPDAFIISTPPDLHVKYAMDAAKRNKHFFMEASVVNEGMDELIALCRNKRIVAAPSCTMRFQASIRKLKELVDCKVIGKVLLFTHHSGLSQILRCQTRNWRGEGNSVFRVGLVGMGLRKHRYCFLLQR